LDKVRDKVRDKVAAGEAGEAVVAGHDHHVPALAAQAVELADPPGAGMGGRQHDLVAFDRLEQQGAHLPPELGRDGPGGEQAAVRAGLPDPAGVETAGAHQEMGVGMQPERLSPGMKGSQGAGQGPQVPGVGQHLPERLPGGTKQQPGHEGAVPAPQLV
jgi:hypothetical protein